MFQRRIGSFIFELRAPVLLPYLAAVMFAIFEDFDLRHFSFRRNRHHVINQLVLADDLIEPDCAEQRAVVPRFRQLQLQVPGLNAGRSLNGLAVGRTEAKLHVFETRGIGEAKFFRVGEGKKLLGPRPTYSSRQAEQQQEEVIAARQPTKSYSRQ